ncbi:Os12g0592600 [Oryza sativa Japonica Group]|uniref:Os12g0592600 protein n=1 Tax=Oryza sativa subsp. japonica TaxID=39947 RepID=A0A0P0YC42_ORYSJ|nr:Os12g0592600 [Oryza sativa Japonica Group]
MAKIATTCSSLPLHERSLATVEKLDECDFCCTGRGSASCKRNARVFEQRYKTSETLAEDIKEEFLLCKEAGIVYGGTE